MRRLFGLMAVVWSGVLTGPFGAPALARTPAPPRSTLASTPWMGWNTWYTYGADYDEADIHQIASALVSDGYARAGYRLVWLDSGWWDGNRNRNGSIGVNRTQWPHGMKALVRFLHSRGLEAGIYTDAGRNGCGRPRMGSLGHIQQDMNTFAAWGFDAVKVDFCGGNELHLNPAKIYTRFATAVTHNASHRPMIFEICDAFGPLNSWRYGPRLAQGWRTGYDISFGDFDPDWSGVLSVGVGRYGSILANLDQDALHPGIAGPGHWNDPDYLQAGVPTLTLAEQTSQFSLWAMLAAPLVIGRNLTTFSPSVRSMLLNREVISVDQDPRGAQAVRVSGAGGLQVWSKKLASPADRAVALFNRTPRPGRITVRWGTIGLRGRVRVRDLWRHRSLGISTGHFSALVPSHATVLLRVHEVTPAG